ncbi:MAG TPA: hypothetical protein VEC99_09920, partial [Clostridia bacterium]|nr:hypothetical protein [Clostridia bacterium]
MRSVRLFVLALTSVLAVPSSFAQFADAVVAYVPGSGVGASYTNAAAALGEPSRVTPGPWGGPISPFSPAWQDDQLVSVGAGGSLTLRLNFPIQPDRTHPFGCDFIVFGGAGFSITNGDYSGGGITDGTLFGSNNGQTRVSVSADGNHFFVLNPALAPTVDTLFPTDGSGDFFRPVNPALVGSSFAGQDLAGIQALYAGSAGGSGYSLGWAQDANGQPVTLTSVQFIRIEVLSGKADIDGVAAVAPIGGGAVWWEDFATDPLARVWSTFGDANLFRWNATNQNLEVTWDSSRTNSYFQLPLGTLLTRRDDFSVALDLTVKDIAIGTNPEKPGTFQIALGFLNQADAERTNFLRGSGSDAPNLVEFSFFPDSGFGATVWPTVYSTNSVMNFSSGSDYSLFDLPLGVPMRVVLSYTASNQTASVSITTNGVLVGPLASAPLSSQFTEFVVDTFAIASYSDAGQEPFMPGSVLAHGVVDNLVVSAPLPALRDFQGALVAGNWQASFQTRTNWNYQLQASEDLSTWKNIGEIISGTGQKVLALDTNAAASG